MRVSNALSDDMDTLRTSLLPSLVEVVALNRDRGQATVCVYEVAEVYLARVGEKDAQPEEPLRIAAIASAGMTAEAGRAAFYRLKSTLDSCVDSLSAPACAYQRAAAQLFHPGRCAAVVMDGKQLGYLGELHPTVASGAKIDERLVAFEIDVEPLLAAARVPRARPLPRFPSVDRDLAVVVDETVAAGVMLGAIHESAGDLLEQVRAFDEYRGAQVTEGHKSLAFTLTFRSPERTLTDAEVDKVMSQIRLALEKRHRARFRE
jgi:phenylalanyl-tRNA synthetase beta chain